MKNIMLLFLFLFTISSFCQSPDEAFTEEVYSGLRNLEKLHKDVKHIHPYLEDLQPIAVVRGEDLFLFDADSTGKYVFVKKVPSPFPMNEGIRASFPFMEYENKPVCFTGKDAFNTAGGKAIILHEFVHCSQYNTIEPELKNNLELYKASLENQNYSWELNHPFPYDSLFLNIYREFHKALQSDDASSAAKYRKMIKDHLSSADFEYLVWQEWKEGFARYLENQIRAEAGAMENNAGNDYAPDRVIFYYGGSTFIKYLVEDNPDLRTNPKQLFNEMFKYPGEKK